MAAFVRILGGNGDVRAGPTDVFSISSMASTTASKVSSVDA
jgi:hypothetical protein